MRIFQAESGRAISINGPIQSMDSFRAEIHAATDIAPNSQIILTLQGAQLKPDVALSALTNDPGNREELVLFVFNRQLLDPRTSWSYMRSSLTLEAPVDADSLLKTHLPVISPAVPQSQVTDSFHSIFRQHLAFAEALWLPISRHAQICEVLLEEQRVQADALSVALTNLQGHTKVLSEAFDTFSSHAHRELSKHSNLLQSFEPDLLALQRIHIHPLISDEPKTLADYVPEERLRTWADNCKAAHEQLLRKTSSLTETMSSIRERTESEMRQPIDVDLPKLESLWASVREMVARADQKRQIFARDLTRVEGILRQMFNGGSELQASDKLLALEHLAKIHRDEYVPETIKADWYIRENVIYFRNSKEHASTQMISRLQSISSIQSSIAAATTLLNTLNTTLSAQSTAFAQLLHVHRMPSAWGATLVEIVRRREYSKVFLSRAKEMAELLSKFRAQEERRRENFKAEIGMYLPSGLIRGLDDKPPYCEISVSGTKDGLPSLNREDISDFEKLVSSIRMSIHEPTTGPAGSTSSAPDAVTKLQATMVRMSPQVDGTATEFDRILAKSSLGEAVRHIDDENARLRGEIIKTGSNSVTTSPSLSRRPGIVKSLSIGPTDGDLARAEETLKAYEKRIKSLELSLRDAYQASRSQVESSGGKTNVGVEEEMAQIRKENQDLRAQVRRSKELESIHIAESLKNALTSLGRQRDIDSDVGKLLNGLQDEVQKLSVGEKSNNKDISHFDPRQSSMSEGSTLPERGPSPTRSYKTALKLSKIVNVGILS
ncbi:hypothetical protein SeMB42_g01328 [Synchytrium endobioticum]|uniref:Autophagy-related protein 11 n=1 Tax=Synchytrium endobioticum TaxID=286115 RepID=A0A507DM08_9FUNG|nr:hypothetical protein SeMB42_g01328 [Synchytrium endobioticum]